MMKRRQPHLFWQLDRKGSRGMGRTGYTITHWKGEEEWKSKNQILLLLLPTDLPNKNVTGLFHLETSKAAEVPKVFSFPWPKALYWGHHYSSPRLYLLEM